MELKKMKIGKKVKFVDNPSCTCSTCQFLRGETVTISYISKNMGISLKESKLDQMFPFDFFEEISYQLPKELFHIEE